MRRIRGTLKWMTACALLVCLCLLAWQCIDIYFTGKAAGTNAALYPDTQMYRWDDVRERLSVLCLPFAFAAVITAVSACVCSRQSETLKTQAKPTLYQRKEPTNSFLVRGILMMLALVFIMLGATNGGLRDVLVKAINICTECIGLG